MRLKKKIAIVIGAFTRLGGAERMAVETCERLKDQFEFHVICREYEVLLDGVKIYKVRRINFPRSLKRLIFAFQVRSVLKKLNVDIRMFLFPLKKGMVSIMSIFVIITINNLKELQKRN